MPGQEVNESETILLLLYRRTDSRQATLCPAEPAGAWGKDTARSSPNTRSAGTGPAGAEWLGPGTCATILSCDRFTRYNASDPRKGPIMADVAVILPAAGAGRRFGGERNKIFETIQGREIFLRTLDRFAHRTDVCQILLVVSAEDADTIGRDYGQDLAALAAAGGPSGHLGAEVVEGGATRTESVRQALEQVRSDADLIAVHDAVRPCVAAAWIDAVFAAAEASRAALLACPLHGTIKRQRADDPRLVDCTVDRAGLWEAQTPQVFAADLLARAYAAGADAPDDAELVQQLPHPVTLVPGDPRNVKITTPADLAFARAVWPSLPE